MQSRRASLIEAAANVVAGLVLSFIMQLVLFKAMGITAGIGQNLLITAAFSALSIARSYVLRRLFNGVDRDGRRLGGPAPARLMP